MKLYKRLAQLTSAYHTCRAQEAKGQTADPPWSRRHLATITKLVLDHMPAGSGFDSGTSLDLSQSTINKLVFETSYHHMNENGFYTHWTHYRVTVKPHLFYEVDIESHGRAATRDEHDFVCEVFHEALTLDLPEIP